MATVLKNILTLKDVGWATLLLAVASLVHFVHNAEYCADYPNLPAWVTAASVYWSWFGMTLVASIAVVFWIFGLKRTALVLFVVYALIGFGGLGHYLVAPVSQHTLVMNSTILLETISAAVLLAASMRSLISRRIDDNAP